MKKLLIALLAGALTFGLVACSDNTAKDDNSVVDKDDQDTNTDDDKDDDADADTDVDTDNDSDEDANANTGDDVNPDTDEDTGLELSEIENMLVEISKTADVAEDYLTMLATSGATTPITEEMEQYFLGSTEYEYVEAYAFEPMMSAQAFSMMIVKANSEDEAATLAEEIKTTVDPIKWVCVSVEPEDVQSAVVGDLVFVVMANDSEKFVEAFQTVAAQ